MTIVSVVRPEDFPEHIALKAQLAEAEKALRGSDNQLAEAIATRDDWENVVKAVKNTLGGVVRERDGLSRQLAEARALLRRTLYADVNGEVRAFLAAPGPTGGAAVVPRPFPPTKGDVWRYRDAKYGVTEWVAIGKLDPAGRPLMWSDYAEREGSFHPADFTDGTLVFVRPAAPTVETGARQVLVGGTMVVELAGVPPARDSTVETGARCPCAAEPVQCNPGAPMPCCCRESVSSFACQHPRCPLFAAKPVSGIPAAPTVETGARPGSDAEGPHDLMCDCAECCAYHARTQPGVGDSRASETPAVDVEALLERALRSVDALAGHLDLALNQGKYRSTTATYCVYDATRLLDEVAAWRARKGAQP